jgi:hypothetical protein
MRENRAADRLSLDGQWTLTCAGRTGPITVPGAWEAQGFGDHTSRSHGEAIYTRAIDVPDSWIGARIVLRFGAASYFAQVYINGAQVGDHEGLWTAFELDVTDRLHIGGLNSLEVRVTKPGIDGDRFHYRETLVGFMPYVFHTFGGLWQPVELIAHRTAAFDVESIRSQIAGVGHREARIMVTAPLTIFAPEGLAEHDRVEARLIDAQGQVIDAKNFSAQEYQARGGSITLSVGEEPGAYSPHVWNPAQPALLTVDLRLMRDDQHVAHYAARTGLRDLHNSLITNQVRGVLSWGWDEHTIAPAPTDDQIRAEFRKVRELSFNLVKLCLFVPHQRVFEIADEEGMLLWLELPLWWQRMTPHLRQQVYIEYRDILRSVCHHPSIVIVSLGCELDADMADADLLRELHALAKFYFPGVLICDNSGSGEAYGGHTDDQSDFYDYHFYCDLHYFRPLIEHFRRDWRTQRSWYFGEFSDSDEYRDPATLPAPDQPGGWWREVYGIEGNPDRWAYPQQEARMAANRAAGWITHTDSQIAAISRRESMVVRKFQLEALRAYDMIHGYVITGLRDTPINVSGLVDDRGQHKFDLAAFRRFNSDHVLLLETARARQWTYGGDRPAPIDRHNVIAGQEVSLRVVSSAYSQRSRASGTVAWWLRTQAGEISAQGEGLMSPEHPYAAIHFAAPTVDQPQELELMVRVEPSTQQSAPGAENAWPLWVFPADQLAPADALERCEVGGVRITRRWSVEERAYIHSGGRLIVLAGLSGDLPVKPVPFWRESIKLLHDHAALAGFPHRGHVDLPFYHLATDSAIDPGALPADWQVRPILRRLDARLFHVLDYAAEVRIGAGAMMISTLRFEGGAGDQVAGFGSSIAGRWLLAALARSLNSI